MAVYLVNIVLIIFWRMCFTQKRFPDARKYFCIIVAFQWILISGLRDLSVGEDTLTYYNHFHQMKQVSWGMTLENLLNVSFQEVMNRDPGYVVLIKLFQLFSGSYQLFLFAIAIFYMTMMAIWIYRYSASPCTSFILFSTLFYSFETLSRQNIAMALVVFWGYDLIQKRKFWKFVAVSVAASLVHKSSLVFFPLFFLVRVPITLGYRILLAVAILAMAVLGKRLYSPIAQWLGYESFLDYAEGGAELYATLLILLCIVVWMLYPRIKNHRIDAAALFHINSISLLTGLMVFHNQSFMRIQVYFSLFLMITIPEIINTVRREYRLFLYLVFGAVMILYLIRGNPQYSFFFMN